LKKKQKQDYQVRSFAGNDKDCVRCRKYCEKHEGLNNENKETHEVNQNNTCSYCRVKLEKSAQVKKEINQMKCELAQCRKNQPEAIKKISELEKQLEKKKEKAQELRNEVFAVRRNCLESRNLEREIRECRKGKKPKGNLQVNEGA